MNLEEFREFCLSLPQASEHAPWSDKQYKNLLTFNVADKWFCLLDMENKFCDVKCDPDTVTEWQERYTGIEPAWHMNKQHWLKIVLESDVPRAIIEQLVERAYQLTVTGLPKAKRQELGLE